MIFLTTYLKVKKMSQEEKEKLAILFEVEVENLKTISPWDWDYKMKDDKFDNYKIWKLEELLTFYESYESRYLNGELNKFNKKRLEHNSKVWQHDGYKRINLYLKFNRRRYKYLNELYKVRKDGYRRDDYNDFFQTPLTKYKPSPEVYEFNDQIYVVQNYCTFMYHDLEHMYLRNFTSLDKSSFLRQDDLEGTVYAWGTKEWLESRIPVQQLDIFSGKKVTCFLYLFFPQTAKECIVPPMLVNEFGPYEINQTNKDSLYNKPDTHLE